MFCIPIAGGRQREAEAGGLAKTEAGKVRGKRIMITERKKKEYINARVGRKK